MNKEELNRIMSETQDPVTMSKQNRMRVYKNDIIVMQQMYHASSTQSVKRLAENVFERTSMMDVLEDPDCTYSPRL